MPITRHAFLPALAALALAAAGRADTFHVTATGADDPGRDGRSAEAAWASLAYACDRVPAGDHTIQLAPGTFTATRTARPKDGVTVAGSGRSGDTATRVVASKEWKLVAAEVLPKPDHEFLVAVKKTKNVTVRDLELASDPAHRVSGAVYGTGCGGLTVRGIAVREFRWAGLYVEHAHKVEIADCVIENGATEKDRHHSGSVRTKWLKDSSIHHCRIVNTVGKEYGYKAGGHENVRFHHNTVEVLGEFAFESAHENEFGLEIDHNALNRCISVPKGGQGADPNTRKFAYSVWVHHNLLTDSYTIEGPRNHLRVSHNYIPIEKTGGRVYSQHGGDNLGPVWIHHNVIENLDRAFVWKNRGRAEGVEVFHNTVYCANAGERAAPVIDAFHSDQQPVARWVVKNNVFVAPKEQPRKLFPARKGTGEQIAFANNVCVNLTGVPDGNFPDTPPGLRLAGKKPWPFYAASAADSFVVDRGVEVGFPFQGKAPDAGAYEFGEEPPAVGPGAE